LNMGTFLKNRVFHKNVNTLPLTKFQNFEKIQIIRYHEKLKGYCKLTPVFVSSICETCKTSTTRDFFKKTHLTKFRENETISKNRKFYVSWHGNVIYFVYDSLLWGILNLGYFWTIEFFTKTPIPPPWRNFRISKKNQITRNHEKLHGYCKLTAVIDSSIGETSKSSTTRNVVPKKLIFQNFEKMKLFPKIRNSTPPDSDML
jgi:hypothetical protein